MPALTDESDIRSDRAAWRPRAARLAGAPTLRRGAIVRQRIVSRQAVGERTNRYPPYVHVAGPTPIGPSRFTQQRRRVSKCPT